MKPEQMEAITAAVNHAIADLQAIAQDAHDEGEHQGAQHYEDEIAGIEEALAALHAAWATIDAPTPSTPAAFRAAIEAVGHNQTTFARHVDVAARTVRCWAAGTPPAPRAIMLLLDHMRRAGQYGPVARTPKPMPAAGQG